MLRKIIIETLCNILLFQPFPNLQYVGSPIRRQRDSFNLQLYELEVRHHPHVPVQPEVQRRVAGIRLLDRRQVRQIGQKFRRLPI